MFGFATEEYSFHESVGVGSLSVALEGDLGDLNLTLFVDTEDDNVNATAEGNTPLQHSLLLCFHHCCCQCLTMQSWFGLFSLPTAGIDYSFLSSVLSFSRATTTVSFGITIIPDDLTELSSESFHAIISRFTLISGFPITTEITRITFSIQRTRVIICDDDSKLAVRGHDTPILTSWADTLYSMYSRGRYQYWHISFVVLA